MTPGFGYNNPDITNFGFTLGGWDCLNCQKLQRTCKQHGNQGDLINGGRAALGSGDYARAHECFEEGRSRWKWDKWNGLVVAALAWEAKFKAASSVDLTIDCARTIEASVLLLPEGAFLKEAWLLWSRDRDLNHGRLGMYLKFRMKAKFRWTPARPADGERAILPASPLHSVNRKLASIERHLLSGLDESSDLRTIVHGAWNSSLSSTYERETMDTAALVQLVTWMAATG